MIGIAAAILALASDGGAAACLPEAPLPDLGAADPFRPPEPKATELNGEGKTLYRQGKWDAARVKYRAAMAADEGFLAPRLNVACSFVRQERFAEATAEVEGLLRRAYVPWAREILEAADLGALKVRPEMAAIRRTMTEAASAWGTGVDESLVFVGRLRAPLRIPESDAGVFLLNPQQEVFAFFPATGRFRQLTAQDGHVLLAVRSPDRRRIVYVTAEKLVRGARAGELALRGVVLHELTSATMSAAAPIPIPGDVRRLEIAAAPAGLTFHLEGDRLSGRFQRAANGALLPAAGGTKVSKKASVLGVLTGGGASSGPPVKLGGRCPVTAREIAAGGGQPGGILVSTPGRPARSRKIGERFGAALIGLPLP